jgi:transposase
VESLRVLRVARCSARKAKAQALNQMRSLVSTAPDDIRSELRRTTGKQLARCSKFRSTGRTDPTSVTKVALRSLARRINDLADEIAELDTLIEPIVNDTAPDLVELTGVGPEIASALLVAAGDNPERLRNEATFAHLCGVAPIDASSGKQERHRLNRGGDRQANSALWRIVLTRLVYDPRTRDYLDRRTKEGLSKKEAIRCLKRYVAREVFNQLPRERLA